MIYFLFFISATALGLLLTPVIKKLAKNRRILDLPDQNRKLHKNPTPLLGGTALYLSFLAALVVYLFFGHPRF